MKRKKQKPYWDMTGAELAQATVEYDAPGAEPKFLPTPKRLKARHDKIVGTIRRRRGRPVVGAGAERVQVTMEHDLLVRADEFARKSGITRSQLIARGLRAVLTGAA